MWPLALYFALALAVATAMIGMSHVLGERHRGRATNEPYESGAPGVKRDRVRLPVHFYLIGMFFVIFDIEAAFLFAWAIAAPELGWRGYVEILIFVGVLLAGLVYLWRVGALDWGTSARVKARAARTPSTARQHPSAQQPAHGRTWAARRHGRARS